MSIVVERSGGRLRVVIYVRVSSTGQAKDDRLGIPRQREACLAYAERQGWTVVRVYEEKGQPRDELWQRPAMTDLRAAAKRREFDVVLCLCIDRLSSNDNHVAILDDEWERIGVRMVFVEEGEFERTPLGRIIRAAKVFAAGVDKEKIKNRTQPARRMRMESGKPLGCGPIKYGLRPADKKRTTWEPDPDTAPVVRLMHEWADQGVSIRDIARRLEVRGHVPPAYARTEGRQGSRRWSTATVRRILTDELYTGVAHAGRYRVVEEARPDGSKKRVVTLLPVDHPDVCRVEAGRYPVLVDPARFARVRRQLEANVRETARHDRRPEVGIFRRGHAFCGVCGHALAVKPTKAGAKPGWQYVCGGHDRWDCGKSAMMTHLLDAEAWPAVLDILNRPERVERRIRQLQAQDTTGDDLAAIDARIAQIEAEMASVASVAATVRNATAAARLAADLDRLGGLLDLARADRAAVADRQASLADNRRRLQAAIDYTAEVRRQLAAEHHAMDWDAKRHALDQLQLRVVVFPEGTVPHWGVWMEWEDEDDATGRRARRSAVEVGGVGRPEWLAVARRNVLSSDAIRPLLDRLADEHEAAVHVPNDSSSGWA